MIKRKIIKEPEKNMSCTEEQRMTTDLLLEIIQMKKMENLQNTKGKKHTK
jgi:hypothetical protein